MPNTNQSLLNKEQQEWLNAWMQQPDIATTFL